MVEMAFEKWARQAIDLMKDAKEIETRARQMLFSVNCTHAEFIMVAQEMQKIRDDDVGTGFIRDWIERRADILFAEIKESMPEKTDGYDSYTVGVFHEWEMLFKDYALSSGEGRLTVRRCRCGAYHEERWNDKERYLTRNWMAKKDATMHEFEKSDKRARRKKD